MLPKYGHIRYGHTRAFFLMLCCSEHLFGAAFLNGKAAIAFVSAYTLSGKML
jgi:hypothetical protein